MPSPSLHPFPQGAAVTKRKRKQCNKCQAWKRAGEFYRNRGGHAASCKTCQKEAARGRYAHQADVIKVQRKQHYQQNRGRILDRLRERVYGLTAEQFAALLDAQGGRCAICKTTEPVPGKAGTWHVDHDHATGAVRGLLCVNCNTVLGRARDNPLTLSYAVLYLFDPPGRRVLIPVIDGNAEPQT